MKTIRKVWRYIAKNKKLLTISIFAMIVVQILGLIAPLIVKTILDDYLVGIESSWYESDTQTNQVFAGKYYTNKPISLEKTSIVIFEGKYFFVYDEVVKGHKSIDQNQLTIKTQDGTVYSYDAFVMSKGEVISFYQPFVKPLFILILLLFLRFILQIIFSYIQRITTMMINVNMVRDARLDAITSLQRMPMTYFEAEPAGKVANRIINDVGGMMNLFSTIMNLLINASMAVVFAYIGMFYLDAKLAIITFVIFPFIYIWLKFFIKKLTKIAVKVNEQSSMITAQLNEIINGISILQVFNFQQQTEDDFNRLSDEYAKEKLKETKLHLSIGWNMIRLVGALVTATIILYFGQSYLTVSGFVVSVGIIYAYNDYLSRLIEPVGTLFREIGNLQHAIVRTERVFKVIDGEQEDGSFELLPRYHGAIEIKNVWFSYNLNNPVLKGVNLSIKAGEMVGLVGHTGSGKTTLMSLLLRFYDIKDTDMGCILIDGVDIKTHAKRSYRKHVGIILQDPVLFKGTIADNVRFGLDVSDDIIEQTIRFIGGGSLLDKLELGVQSNVSRSGANFSVGEKQIISFARAILHDPPILIMDEATANIDTETERIIQNALDKVKVGRTMIVIAHRLSTIKFADKIVVLENGFKVEEGNHEALLANNGVYANIYRSQIK